MRRRSVDIGCEYSIQRIHCYYPPSGSQPPYIVVAAGPSTSVARRDLIFQTTPKYIHCHRQSIQPLLPHPASDRFLSTVPLTIDKGTTTKT